jgi:hypothetical protein
MKYWILRPDGTESEGEVDWSEIGRELPGYFEICDVVIPLLGEAPLQREAVFYNGENTDLFHAPLGFVETASREKLPLNEKATAVFLERWPELHPNDDPEGVRPIHGVAVIFEKMIWQ